MRYLKNLCWLIILLPMHAYADIDNQNLFNNVAMRFKDNASSWANILTVQATHLFWSLAVISMVWTFIPVLFRRENFDEFFVELIRFIVSLGFFWWLLINGPAISIAIISSLCQIAASASGVPDAMSPSGIVDIGFNIVSATINHVSVTSPVMSAMAIIIAVLVLCSLALVGVDMLLLLIASWMLSYAGVFVLGFGGSKWTSEIAINYYKKVLSVGISLFAMILIVGIGKSFIDQSYAAMGQTVHLEDLVVMLVVCIILLSMVKKLPPLMADIIGIGSFSNGGFSGAAGAAGVAMAASSMAIGAATANAAGGAQAVKAAFQSAQKDLGESAGKGVSGAFSNAGRLAAGTMGHLAKGAGSATIGSVVNANRFNQSFGGKVASAIKDKAQS